MKLSIITPYYKTLEYIKKLAEILEPQLNDDCEWIIIDDGCYEKELDNLNAKVIHQKNGGVSNARNKGLDIAKGEYITFIDSDDNVKPNYIKTILGKINTSKFDYCMFSWEAIGYLSRQIIIKDNAPSWNTSVWNCIYKKSSIGNSKFNEKLTIGEDEKFNLEVRKGKKENIEDILYIYRSGRQDGLTNLFNRGLITKEYTTQIRCGLLLYQKFISKIGGIETFIYNFAKLLHDEYDIILVYDEANDDQLKRYKEYIKCIKNTGQKFICDKYLCISNQKNIAGNVTSTENWYADMIHADFKALGWRYIPNIKTTLHIAVSETAKKGFEGQDDKPCIVVYNLLEIPKVKKVLNIISANRISPEKGENEMKIFANKLKERNIPFNWICFTDNKQGEDNNILFRSSVYNIEDYIKNADYFFTGSKTESYGYSVVQALSLGTPIIAFNYPALDEIGFKDKEMGYLLNKDMSNMDEIIDNIYNIPKFEYKKLDNIQDWINLLGKLNKYNDYKGEKNMKYLVKFNEGYALNYFDDSQCLDESGRMIRRSKNSEPWIVNAERKDFLLARKAIIVLEEIPEEIKENKTKKSNKKNNG